MYRLALTKHTKVPSPASFVLGLSGGTPFDSRVVRATPSREQHSGTALLLAGYSTELPNPGP